MGIPFGVINLNKSRKISDPFFNAKIDAENEEIYSDVI